MKKKMFILGAYGCGNRGDDAILASLCDLFPTWEICATNGYFYDISEFLPIKTVKCRLNEGFSFRILLSMLGNSAVMLREIAKSDVLVFGGGSLIHDLTPYNLPFLFFWHTWAKILKKRIVYFSMGVGPLQTDFGKFLCSRFLRSADKIYVRDQHGFDLCMQMKLENVELTADAVFAATTADKKQYNTMEQLGVRDGQYFCVTASQWFTSSNFWKRNSMDFSEEIKNLSQCIRVVAETIKQPVVFVPTVVHDASLGMELKKILSDLDFHIVPSDWNCMQMSEVISNSSFLLGVRMHSIIFAARHGVPFMALVYDGKVQQLLKRLKMEDYSIPLHTAKPEMIQELFSRIQKTRRVISDTLLKESIQLKESVLKSRDDVVSIL